MSAVAHILEAHDPLLVGLAVVVCLVGAVSGMRLWSIGLSASNEGRWDWLFLASINLGVTIWTTHFVAMLGYGPSAAATFHIQQTLASVAIAILGVALAIWLSFRVPTFVSTPLSGAVLAAAIATMHAVGMRGFDVGMPLGFADLVTAEAIVTGAAFSIAAIHVLRVAKGERLPKMAPLLFSLAIASIHFLSMAAYHAVFLEEAVPVGATSDNGGFALAVVLVAMLLTAMAIASTAAQRRAKAHTDASLIESSLRDHLTGVANRAGFEASLGATLRDTTADTRTPSVILIDIDRFKTVTDAFGYGVGDIVLRRVVRRVQAAVSEPDFVARLGGDEFAVIASPDRPAGDAERLAARIVDFLARPYLINGHVLDCTASVGIVECPGPDADAQRLVRWADAALGAAKTDGGARWRKFDQQILHQIEAKRRLEFDLGRALVREEFQLYYQALVDAHAGGFVGAEALLRWNPAELGLVSPATFIPLAEKAGHIAAIGRWVLHTACRDAATWPDHLKVSVNLSPVQLMDARLIENVQNALTASGLRPERLELEVTESALIRNEDHTIAVLSALRDIGISIALDDFGTGYSSLSYLHRFPLDRIKIDQSFVMSATSDDKSARIVEAISHLGRVLGLSVTAEGVETSAHLDVIRTNGCDVAQGYLFSRPCPLAALPDDFTGQSAAKSRSA